MSQPGAWRPNLRPEHRVYIVPLRIVKIVGIAPRFRRPAVEGDQPGLVHCGIDEL